MAGTVQQAPERRELGSTASRLLATCVVACTTRFGQGLPAQPSSTADSQAASGGSSGDDTFSRVIDALADAALSTDEGPAPRWESWQSPRHALLTFSEAMDEILEGKDRWGRALESLPPGDPGDAGRREAAHDLKAVLDRLGGLDPLLLPGPETVSRRGMRRYDFFPTHRFAWVWDRLDQAPVGSIVLVRNEEGAWRFTPETVAGAAELLESLRGLPPREHSDEEPSSLKYVLSPTL